MVESGIVPGKNRILTSIEKLSRRVSEKGRICVRTKKWYNMNEYQEKVEFLRVSKHYPGEYRKRVESVWVPKTDGIRASTGKGRIPTSIEKLSRRVPEKGRIYLNNEKW